MKTIKKSYKNPISRALADYREDFNSNWDWNREHFNKFNEYLYIQYLNGDTFCISDQDWFEENASLPRFNSAKILYVSRFFGCGCERITAKDIEIDTDRIILFDKMGKEYIRYEMTAEERREMLKSMDTYLAENDFTDGSLYCIGYCRALAKLRFGKF